MLEVDDGTEGWKLLHQSGLGESTISQKYTIRNKTDEDVLVYLNKIRPTYPDAEGFTIRKLQVQGEGSPPAVSSPIPVSSISRTNWQIRSPTSRCSDRGR